MMRLAKDEHYGDPRALLMAYAGRLTRLRDWKKAGADIVQLDSRLSSRSSRRRRSSRRDRPRAEGISHDRRHLCSATGTTSRSKLDRYHFLALLNARRAAQTSIEAAQPGSIRDVRPAAGQAVMVGVLDRRTHGRDAEIVAAVCARRSAISPERVVAPVAA
jgi:hypothetical protein